MGNIQRDIKHKLGKSIKRWMRRKRKISSGQNRAVYDLNNGCVLKVVKNKTGIGHNLREIKIYKSLDSSIRKHLAEIKDYGSLWLIMKKYDREFPKSSKTYRKKLKKLKSKFKKKGIDPKDMFNRNNNPKTKNLRLNDKGRIIVIDYGDFKFKK